ncbi:MAG: zinc ribbon domain-containing protein, partial [Bacillota bacterium]|nr:zinc ribbon domain-containing protein [Bacillota bacterium]
DAIHKATSVVIAKQPVAVGLESLNTAGMMKNRRLARTIADASLAEIHRQLEYKAKWAGIKIVNADHWFPSSKTCSACGVVKDVLGPGLPGSGRGSRNRAPDGTVS